MPISDETSRYYPTVNHCAYCQQPIKEKKLHKVDTQRFSKDTGKRVLDCHSLEKQVPLCKKHYDQLTKS